MSAVTTAVVAGIAFGAIAVATMLPMQFADKRSALLAAFISRFGIGLVVSLVELPWPGWVSGLTLGVLLSFPDAIVTKAYGPILGLGAVGGLLIGGFVHGW